MKATCAVTLAVVSGVSAFVTPSAFNGAALTTTHAKVILKLHVLVCSQSTVHRGAEQC
jgi:hypothetical protein